MSYDRNVIEHSSHMAASHCRMCILSIIDPRKLLSTFCKKLFNHFLYKSCKIFIVVISNLFSTYLFSEYSLPARKRERDRSGQRNEIYSIRNWKMFKKERKIKRKKNTTYLKI